MKRTKLLVTIILIMSLLMLASCGKKEEKKEETKKEVEKEVVKKDEPKEEEKKEKEEEPKEKGVVNIYSSRHYDVDKVVYEKFEEETGIKVNVVEGKGGELFERIKREKDNPQADLFFTVGAETIQPLKADDLIEEYSSDILKKNIPAEYIGKGWNGVMSRARIIAYSKDRVDPSTIKSYEDLADPKYKGKILVRSSKSSYNQALLSSFIELNGAEKAKEWAKAIVDNMSREPKGNDRDQAKAVVAGEGDFAIMNSYYFVRMARSSDKAEVEVTEKIGLLFPENTHLNLSYSAMLKGAKNKENAVKFIEFITSDYVQGLYADKNGEFPLNEAVKYPEIQKSWGDFTKQKLNFEEFGKHRIDAVKIFDEVNWK